MKINTFFFNRDFLRYSAFWFCGLANIWVLDTIARLIAFNLPWSHSLTFKKINKFSLHWRDDCMHLIWYHTGMPSWKRHCTHYYWMNVDESCPFSAGQGLSLLNRLSCCIPSVRRNRRWTQTTERVPLCIFWTTSTRPQSTPQWRVWRCLSGTNNDFCKVCI